MKSEFDFKLLEFHELDDFLKFMKEHWDINHIFIKDTSVFDWQHKGDQFYHYMIAKKNNEIVGIHGVIPLNHFDKKLPNNQIFIALWRVIEGKGIGIGLRIFKQMLKAYEPNLIVGLPVTSAVNKFYETQGFKVVFLDHFVFLLNESKKFKIAQVPNDIERKELRINKKYEYKKLTIKDIKALKTDHLYEYQLPLKSDDYIINRYMKHPIYKYEVFAVLNNQMVEALCVLRPIRKEGAVIITIMDFIGPDNKFPSIRFLAQCLIKEYNAEYIDIYVYGIPQEFLIDAGFIDRKKYNNLIIPGYFEPFLKKNYNIGCAFKYSHVNIPIRIFKGDGDADRPRKMVA